MLLTASLLALFPTGLLLPVYAVFVKNVGGDVLDAGIAYGLFSITAGVFVFFVAKMSLFKYQLRRMVVIGYTLLALGELSYFFITTPSQLFMAQIVVGIAAGILDPSWDSLYSMSKSESEALHSWSLWSSGQRIVTGFGAIVGTVVIGYYSFSVLFSLMLVANLLAAGVSSLILLKES